MVEEQTWLNSVRNIKYFKSRDVLPFGNQETNILQRFGFEKLMDPDNHFDDDNWFENDLDSYTNMNEIDIGNDNKNVKQKEDKNGKKEIDDDDDEGKNIYSENCNDNDSNKKPKISRRNTRSRRTQTQAELDAECKRIVSTTVVQSKNISKSHKKPGSDYELEEFYFCDDTNLVEDKYFKAIS